MTFEEFMANFTKREQKIRKIEEEIKRILERIDAEIALVEEMENEK